MDDAARDYIDAIAPEHRPLFDRFHRLVLEVHPDAEVVLSYQIPTYNVGRYRHYVGVWKHRLSFYGWEEDRDAGFSARHPELVTSKGTRGVADRVRVFADRYPATAEPFDWIYTRDDPNTFLKRLGDHREPARSPLSA